MTGSNKSSQRSKPTSPSNMMSVGAADADPGVLSAAEEAAVSRPKRSVSYDEIGRVGASGRRMRKKVRADDASVTEHDHASRSSSRRGVPTVAVPEGTSRHPHALGTRSSSYDETGSRRKPKSSRTRDKEVAAIRAEIDLLAKQLSTNNKEEIAGLNKQLADLRAKLAKETAISNKLKVISQSGALPIIDEQKAKVRQAEAATKAAQARTAEAEAELEEIKRTASERVSSKEPADAKATVIDQMIEADEANAPPPPLMAPPPPAAAAPAIIVKKTHVSDSEDTEDDATNIALAAPAVPTVSAVNNDALLDQALEDMQPTQVEPLLNQPKQRSKLRRFLDDAKAAAPYVGLALFLGIGGALALVLIPGGFAAIPVIGLVVLQALTVPGTIAAVAVLFSAAVLGIEVGILKAVDAIRNRKKGNVDVIEIVADDAPVIVPKTTGSVVQRLSESASHSRSNSGRDVYAVLEPGQSVVIDLDNLSKSKVDDKKTVSALNALDAPVDAPKPKRSIFQRVQETAEEKAAKLRSHLPTLRKSTMVI